MKYHQTLVLMGLLLSAAATHASLGPDSYAVYGVAGWDGLNLRSTPSSKGKILRKIPFNAIGIQNLAKSGSGWCKVKYANTIGWAACTRLMEDPNKRYYSAHGYPVPMPIQAEPRLNSPTVSRLPLEAEGLRGLDGCSGNWCRIDYQGHRGYVQQKYLVSTKPPVVKPPVTPQPR